MPKEQVGQVVYFWYAFVATSLARDRLCSFGKFFSHSISSCTVMTGQQPRMHGACRPGFKSEKPEMGYPVIQPVLQYGEHGREWQLQSWFVDANSMRSVAQLTP